MHIAIATAEFVTEKEFSGGLANYTANIARILRKYGHEVSVFVTSTEDKILIWEKGIKVYRIKYESKSVKSKFHLLKYMIAGVWAYLGKSYIINKRINEINKKQKIDIIHFASSESLALFRNKKIPAVVRMSTYVPLMRQAMNCEFNFEKCVNNLTLAERLQMFSVKNAETIFAPSHLTAKLVEKKIKRKVEVIESPFLINIDEIDETLYKQTLADKKYFLFYGTLGYLKGIHTIAKILERLFDENPEYYFVFIGNTVKMTYGGEKIDAVDYILRVVPEKYKHKIIYIPAISNKSQLYAIIKHAQACVLPSRFDNLPNTCIESMALGQIVIGTEGASFEQLIKDGISGYLIERENAEELYEKIQAVMQLNKQERETMERNSKQRIEELRPDKIYEQLTKLYKETMNKHKGV